MCHSRYVQAHMLIIGMKKMSTYLEEESNVTRFIVIYINGVVSVFLWLLIISNLYEIYGGSINDGDNGDDDEDGDDNGKDDG